ncbi:MAG: polyprenyl synthetase family protein [Phycisphaerales bacterium]|nr:polyprenyl synthetase family protein [Phycisphaerales bacterium]
MTSVNTQQIVPQDWAVRLQIRDAARRYVREQQIVPPQTLERLRFHAGCCLEKTERGQPRDLYEDFAVIMLNNALWETCFSHIPKDQRLLLLPMCLRNYAQCQAPRDELGLICSQCGQCGVPALSEKADALGMPVLVAESSSMVSEWVKRGEIQAIVGVSCLDSLRKAFPAMLRHAIPGIAIPLTKDGCRDTTFDMALLNDALALDDCAEPFAVSNVDLHELMRSLFSSRELAKYLHASTPYLRDFSNEIYRSLCAHGKHYRPMIVFGTYSAMTNRADFPSFLTPIALAVECFHKASLIHDDIEDDDATRYDEPTLHHRVGTPVALNMGDFLIGEGYRLLGHASIPRELRVNLIAQAAQAHCELSLGQAQELESLGKNMMLEQCLETHRLKTAPAFRVPMLMGAIAAGKFDEYYAVFHEFSDLFGVSYQLRDDLDDVSENPASAVDCLIRHENVTRESARARIVALYETYRLKTYNVLEQITDPLLKIFMYRLIGKVLKDV